MDKVRLLPLQRAELEDHLALQNLNYEHSKRATGQLLGTASMTVPSGGLLSHVSPTINSNLGLLSLKSFSFCSFQEGADQSNGVVRTPLAQIARFDSGVEGHSNYPIDISIIVPGTTFLLYAKPTTVESDNGARRQFSVVTGQEEPITMNTRERERIAFELVKSPGVPSGDNWAWIGTVSVSSGGATSFIPHSLWDDANRQVIDRGLTPTIPESVLESSSLLSDPAREGSLTLGLNEMLALLRHQLSRIQYAGELDTTALPSDTTKKWHQAPVKSLQGLYDDIVTLNNYFTTEITSLDNQLTPLTQVYDLYFSYLLYWSTSSSYFVVNKRDPLNCTATLDADAIAGTTGGMGGGFTAEQFERVLRKPVICLPAGDWQIISHNITPVISHTTFSSSVDSLTDPGEVDGQPLPFSYAKRFYTPTSSFPLPRTPDLALTNYDITNPFDPTETLNKTNAVPFVIRCEPNLVEGELRVRYDIQLKVRKL
jgi:hypothetical protein